ncbi:MAG: hypothetical protein UT63_C0018G0003 [Candidatus Gottesmanbacteria bacterium GW2011_GWC2_39_8]|uniref:BrnT family toxin n=1 Tax=Candidatus Gottesmanbacteria bacterium GW2011_GWC2_39_8 TaxID=1618450 RepID=A0A0G0PZM7_9BACT|nr:MAG: hypothetical protein UT63_C0018G0003 [Candidatus Gottesmanbacteria bacterium GW2011_GWC2_39_8]
MIQINKIVWDDWNTEHIGKHKVSADEVEEVCRKTQNVLTTYGGRIMVLGRTKEGRFLSVILSPKDEKSYYVVTARDMSQKERKYFYDKNK